MLLLLLRFCGSRKDKMKFVAGEISFAVGSDLVVVGCNPEMADITNPRGEILSEIYYIVATNPNGDRRRSENLGINLNAAERLVTVFENRGAMGKVPVGFDRWADERPEYGSNAYEQYGAADDIAWERGQEE